MGSPRQEQFIYNNKTLLRVKVAIGVGGVLDVLSGNIKRAPELFQKMNLEWFYRLLTNPKRLFRQLSLFKFAIKVFGAALGFGKK
jgi:N-acetylglucosaminyldiphosphoundecaprenol N-acetyl-beta-D-mannosaminyltransferase